MKAVYHSHTSLEASMIVDLLAQCGVHGHVFGEALQGGAGELPATGVVRVMVNNDDEANAKEVIQQWEERQPIASGNRDSASLHPNSAHHSDDTYRDHNSNRQRSHVIGAFMLGVLVGAFFALL